MTVILDASALLALINEEPGMDVVAAKLDEASMSTVNVAEVSAKLVEKSWDPTSITDFWRDLDIPLLSFDLNVALISAELRPQTKDLGLSFGDRACLATAIMHECEAMTADQQWGQISLDGLTIVQIR